MLEGSPYLLDHDTGPKILKSANDLAEQVHLLRKHGSIKDDTLRRLREEWGIRQVYD